MSWFRTLLLLLTVSLVAPACGGSDGGDGAPDTAGGDADAEAPTDSAEPPDGTADGTAGDATGDAADGVAPPATVSCALVLRDGERALEGALSLTLAEELPDYADTPGLQVDLRFEATGVPAASEARFTVGGEPYGDVAVVPDAGGAVSASLPTVTLPHTAEDVAATMAIVAGEETLATCTATIRVDLGPCPVAIEPPAVACLTNDEDMAPGFQRRFVVRSEGGLCDRAALLYQVGDTPLQLPAVPLDETGAAEFLVTLFPSASGLDDEGVIVTGIASDSANPDRDAQTTPRVYTVDTEPPRVEIETPVGDTLTVEDDADGDPTNGLQVVVSGRAPGLVPEDGLALSLAVDGDVQRTTEVAADGSFAFGAVSFTEPATVQLEVRAVDACGQEGGWTAALTVYPVLPELAIVTPADEAALWSRDDGDPATALTYEIDFVVQAVGVEEGRTLTVRCRRDTADAPQMVVGELTIDDPSEDGRYPIAVALRVDLQGNEQRCVVATDGANAATSPSVGLWVALPAPRLTLLTPEDEALVSGDAVVATGTADNLSGQPLELHLDDEEGVPRIVTIAETPILGGAFSGTIPFELAGAPLPDGRYRVWVDATDTLGNVASDQAGSDVAAWITLDRTPPVLTFAWPPPEGLNPSTDPAAVDVAPDTPGYQADVRVQVAGEAAPDGVEVCLARDGARQGCVTLGADETIAGFAAVTFQPGANTLVASATDRAGNAGETAPYPVELVFDAPRVVFDEPAAGLVTAEPTVDVVLRVTGDAGAIDGAAVTLHVNDVLLDAAPEALGGGRYRFAAVPLAEGENVLEGRATAGGSEGSTGPHRVTYKVDGPVLTFETPTDGATINLATAACDPGQADCVLAVVVGTANLEDGAAATLTVDCGDGPAAFEASAADDTVTFPGVVLPDGATCSLAASATDVVGQEAEVGPISVTVDRTAPVVEAIELPEVLQAADDEQPEVPGMQVTLGVRLGGLEAGRTVSVHAENSVGVAFDATFDLPEAIPDGTIAPIAIPAVTLPEDFVEVTVDVTDAAGNAAETARASAFVNSEQPDVRLLLPTRIPNDPCATNADCASGGVCGAEGCGTPWGAAVTFEVQVGFQGVALGEDSLRICSDHPDIADAPACATGGGGFHELVRTDVTGEVTTLAVETLIPEGFQTIVAEAEALPGNGEWTSSLDNPIDTYRRRFLYVDTQPPTLTGLTSPSDTLAPTGVLNAAEQSAPGRRYRVRVTSDEDGRATLYVNGIEDGVATIAGGVGELDVTLVEGGNTVQARLTDLVGNLAALAPDPAYAPFVDTVAPTLAFVTPDRSPILAGDPRDVVLTSSAIGRSVTLFDGEPPVELAAAAVGDDGRATFPHDAVGALTDGTHQLTARVSDEAGNVATAATSPAVVQVDTEPPTLTVAAPVSGAVFTDDDDAGPAMGGFQVLVRFTPAGATTWSLSLASDCDAAWENCGAPLPKGSGDVTGGEVGRTVTVPVSDATSYHVLRVDVRDGLGNLTREEVPFSLQLTSCVVAIGGLPASGVYNNNACEASPGRDCASVDDTLSVSVSMSCVGAETVALYRDDVEIARTSDIDAEGTATLAVTFSHGAAFELSARALAGDDVTVLGDSGGLPILVDLVDPSPSFVATVVDGFPTPASGARPLYGVADDQQPASAETAEIHVQVTATDDTGLVGGEIVAFFRTTGDESVPLAPSNASFPLPILAEPWSVDLKNLSLPHGGPHTLRITVRDGAGNTATTAIVPTVDLLPPDPIVLAPIEAVDVNPRRPSIDLGWTAVGDDGDAGDPVAGYDVRYAFLPIGDDLAFEAACPADELVGGLPLPTPGAPGAAESFTLDGPDARAPDDPCRFLTSLDPQTIHVAVRAIDDAGNVSPLGAASTRSTAAVQLRTAAITHQDIAVDPANEGDIDYWVWAVGDLDGDGRQDMALGGFWASAICVLYGHAEGDDLAFPDYLMDGRSGPDHVCLADTGLTYFGFTTADAVDVNGDGVQDLVVGSGSRFPGWPADETVRVYLGRAGALLDPTPNVTIVGMETFQFTGLHVDAAGNFNGDTFEGRPVEDIIIASDLEGPAGAETGAVYVVPGSASWNAATSLTIDVSDPADRAANDVARIALQGAVPVFDDGTYVPPLFGYRVAAAGDILPDAGETQYDDVLIAQRIHRRAVYLVRGRPLTGGAEILITDGATVPDPPTGEDAQVVRLQPEFVVNKPNFGDTLLGGVDLDGRGVPDVIVTHPINAPGNDIHVFWGEELQGREGQIVTRISLSDPPETVGDGVLRGLRGVIVPGSYQRPALAGDFDDAGGTTDLVYGLKGVSDFGAAFLRLNLGLPALEGTLGVFPFEDLAFEDPTGGGSLCFGSSLAGPGDVNGDGFPDLLVGGAGCGTAWLIY